MKKTVQARLREVVKIISKDKNVVAVILYGSFIRKKEYARDVDLCVVLSKRYSNPEMGKKRLRYLTQIPGIFDVQIFQLLPLYVRKSVLKEGKILYIRDKKRLYDIAYDFIKEYNLFEPYYKEYIEATA